MTPSRLRSLGARRFGLATLALVAGLVALPAAQTPAPAGVCDLQTTDRIVAVGDVHGAFDRFVAILREAGLIDNRRRWTGGKAIFVQTGDIFDRGADSRQALDLLRKLEGEAASAGGRVVALLGNHEVMRILGDARYVSAGEYAAFRSADAVELRERYYTVALNEEVKKARAASQTFDEKAFRKKFEADVPLGFVEMLLAFAADGDYGRWVRARDAVAIVNGIAFVHGGVSPAVAPLGCAGINAKVRAELATASLTDPNMNQTLIGGPTGPLWFRGLVDGSATDADVTAVLQALGARAIVVGHTSPDARTVQTSFGGRVIQIDTGMIGGTFFAGGVASALEIRGDTRTAIYEGRREVIK